MARTSKRRKKEQIIVCSKRFHAGIYARLSVETDTRKNESIDMQIAIIKEYMKKHTEIELFDCYVDLGKTGTNFHRKEFERMMEDVRKKRINCIIVKDLSRFGRNHLETGNYLQKIFPFMGVRFIAVTDGIDTFQKETADGMTVNLKNLLNEMYAKDIAAKVKSSIRLRQEQGSYTGGMPPYGYIVKWEDGKRKLFIHEETAGIVKNIYGMYLDGKGLKQIVEVLYDKRVHRPAVYRKNGHVFCREGELLEQWGTTTVKRILTNPVYTGNCCYAQDVIISEASFFHVAEMFHHTAKKTYNQRDFSGKVPVSEDIYEGRLFCGDCGKEMKRTVNVKELCSGDMMCHYSYYCPDSRRIDSLKCPPKGIGLNVLDGLVRNALQQEFLLFDLNQKRWGEMQKRKEEDLEKQFRQEISKCERKLKNRERRSSELYIKYYMGEISLKEYQEYESQNKEWFYEVLERKKSLTERFRILKRNAAKENTAIIGLMEGRGNLTKEIIYTWIKRIEVYQNHEIKIIFADL